MSAGRSRLAASIALLVTVPALAYTVALLLGLEDPSWAYWPRGLMHLGELAAVVALALSGAPGRGRLAMAGIGAAGLGCLVLAVAEVLIETSQGLGNALFGLGPTLVGVGLVLAGIAVVRNEMWTGWQRYVPVTLGIYVFVVLTPVLIASGGPPAVASLLALTGWEVLWLLVAIGVLTETTAARRQPAPAMA